MLEGRAAHFSSVHESPVMTFQVNSFKNSSRQLANRAMLSRNRSVAHLHLVRGIPAQKQRSILEGPDRLFQQAGNCQQSRAEQGFLRLPSVAESAAEPSSNQLRIPGNQK